MNNNATVSSSFNAKNIAVIGLLGALTAVLGMTPLGFIPVGPTRATIMHIPVIVGSILYGPMVGGFVGLIFGIFSLINALINMTPVSFVFINPIVSIFPRVMIGIGSYYVYEAVKKLGKDKLKWLLTAVWIAIVGYLGYGLYNNIIESSVSGIVINLLFLAIAIGIFLYSYKKYNFQSVDVTLAAIAGTMINTVGVMSLIYFIYGERFVEAMGHDIETARKVILGISVINGIPECILAAILVTSVVKAVQKRR